jgi:acetoin utilization protein AcuC
VVRAALVWDDALASYRFHLEHPLNPRRLELTLGLVRAMGLEEAPETVVVAPRQPTADEILAVHSAEYVDAVRRSSIPGASSDEFTRYGIGTEDVPVTPGVHVAGLHVVGSTLTAADQVMAGGARTAFSVAGGLHHARRAEAAGFCIYNDLAVAIAHMKRTYGARVMYIDVDAHHGDGVEAIFRDDPDVLTLSFHESGTYLFPGTGFIDEMGSGDGTGYSVNVPLDAHTEDASFERCYDAVVPDVAKAFAPDVIVLQCGCDAHVLDPLTHLRCTTHLYEHVVGRTMALADELCEGRLVVTGGGGYAIHSVVPRVWTLVWSILAGVDAPNALPPEWVKSARLDCGREVPCTLRDAPGAFPGSPRREIVEATNDRTAAAVRRRVLPLISGWGLAF